MSVYYHSSGDDLEPVFPPEIERELFLQVARSSEDDSVSVRLMLVAYRVKRWIESYLYKTILLRGADRAVKLVESLRHRLEFARRHVKALCIEPSIPLRLVIQLLSTCTGLESLALWIHPQSDTAQLTDCVASLPLAFLSLSLSSIVPPSFSKPALENHPAFMNLTHLDVVNNWVLWKPSLGIEHLPRLTHVSFRFWSRGRVNKALTTILKQSRNLQVLVLLADAAVMPGAQAYLEKEDVKDVRVVVLKHVRDIHDWMAIKREAESVWQRADRIVRWRRSHRAGPFDYPSEFVS